MTDTSIGIERPVTRRDLVEGRIERVLTDKSASVGAGGEIGGLQLDNMLKVAEAAKLMSTAGPMLPPWLQGNVGGCWGIILRAMELQMSPLTLAQWSYVTTNGGVQRVAYESAFYHSVIEAKAPITTRLNSRYEGQGDDRKCFVFATFKGETEPREWPPRDSADQFTLGKLRPQRNEYGKIKGSPLWDIKPDLQLFYNISRDWARVYCPDILAGLYTRDEPPDDEPARVGPDKARDVSPKLADRLRGPTGEGFAGQRIAQHIDAALDAARDGNNSGKHEPQLVHAEGPAQATPIAAGAGADTATVPAVSAPTNSNPLPSAASSSDGAGGEAAPVTPPAADAADQSADGARDAIAKEDSINIARARGRKARGDGVKKRALPPEYRERGRTAEAIAWVEGWDLKNAL